MLKLIEQRIQWICVFLLSLAIISVPFSTYLVKRFIYLAFLFLLFLKLSAFFIKKKPLFKKTYLDKTLLIFLGALLLSTLLSKNFYESQKVFVGRILFYAGIFLLVKETVDTKAKVYLILGSFVFTGFIVGLDGLWQYFKGYDFFFGYPKNDPGVGKIVALSGPFGRYNFFSGYLEIVLPLITLLSFIRKKIYVKFFILITFVLLLICWIHVFQRGTWLSVILAVFLALFFMNKKYLYYFFVGIVFLAFLLPDVGYQRILKTFKPGGDTGRFFLWRRAIDIFLRAPIIGNGLGSYGRYSGSVMHADNIYVELLADAGILGLLSFLLLLGFFLKNSIFYVSKIENHDKKIIFLGLFASSFSSIFIGLLSSNMLVGIGCAMMFWTILSLAVVLKDVMF